MLRLNATCLVASGLAAVDVQDLPSDVGRGLQEQDAVDDVADLADAAERGKLATEPLVSAASTEGACEFATSARVAEMLTTWPPYRRTISAMTRWVSQKNPPRLTPVSRA